MPAVLPFGQRNREGVSSVNRERLSVMIARKQLGLFAPKAGIHRHELTSASSPDSKNIRNRNECTADACEKHKLTDTESRRPATRALEVSERLVAAMWSAFAK